MVGEQSPSNPIEITLARDSKIRAPTSGANSETYRTRVDDYGTTKNAAEEDSFSTISRVRARHTNYRLRILSQ